MGGVVIPVTVRASLLHERVDQIVRDCRDQVDDEPRPAVVPSYHPRVQTDLIVPPIRDSRRKVEEDVDGEGDRDDEAVSELSRIVQ